MRCVLKTAMTSIVFFGLITMIACKNNESLNTTISNNYVSEAKTYLSFNENNSSSVTDEITGKIYDISYVYTNAKYKSVCDPIRSEGVRGNALLFDGNSTSIEVNDYYNPNGQFTISLWLSPRAYEYLTENSVTGLLSNLSATGGFELGVLQYGNISFKIVTSRGTKQYITDDIVDLYSWNHIIISYSANEINIYKNGINILSESNGEATPLMSSGVLLIGKSKTQSIHSSVFLGNMFSGLIDELEIYSEAFSDKTALKKFEDTINISIPEIDKYGGSYWLSYDTLADDRYAPQYHLRVPIAWSNEVYGFFYYKGQYHCFCQFNPYGAYYNEGQRWGHFVSNDLVHWEFIVPALITEENGIDNIQVFSGSSILNNDGDPVLFYTGVNYAADDIFQISLARPSDFTDPNLEEWDKLERTVLVTSDEIENREIRDPFIYKENDNYYMLLGSTTSDRIKGSICTYKATDSTLEHWEFLGETFTGEILTDDYLGSFYELPNLYKVYSKDKSMYKYMLMFSPINKSINGVYYVLGEFDLETGVFTPDTNTAYRFDLGPVSQVLCGSGFYDEHTDRNLFLTMSRTGLTSQNSYDSGWANVMTVVKEIYLNDDGLVQFKPIDEYSLLQSENLINITDQDLAFDEVDEMLYGISRDMLMIKITIDPKNAKRVGMYVKYDYSGSERTLVYYDLETQKFYIDNSKTSLDLWNNGSGGGTVDIGNDLVTFTIYVDRSMVEAFLNCSNEITTFGYSRSASANSLKMYALDGSPSVVNLQVYEIDSAYGKYIEPYWD